MEQTVELRHLEAQVLKFRDNFREGTSEESASGTHGPQ